MAFATTPRLRRTLTELLLLAGGLLLVYQVFVLAKDRLEGLTRVEAVQEDAQSKNR